MTARHEFFRWDGLRVPVEIHGDGEPVIFLPGLGAHPRYYGAGMALLGRHFTVFVPDLSFRTHSDLPVAVDRYRELVDAVAGKYAPEAFRAGHSYGGTLALLGSGPAVALSPMIPLTVGWGRQVGRAVRLQLREYLGFDGRRGAGWAWSIMRDYVGAAVRNPASLFPIVSETLQGIAHSFLPTARRAHIVLAQYDQLYQAAEVEAFLAASTRDRVVVRHVPCGHDWPVTHPELLETEILEAVSSTRAA